MPRSGGSLLAEVFDEYRGEFSGACSDADAFKGEVLKAGAEARHALSGSLKRVLGMFGSGHAREQDPRQCIHRGPIEPKAVVDLHTVCSMTRLIGEAS